jgi:hypothetical protein
MGSKEVVVCFLLDGFRHFLKLLGRRDDAFLNPLPVEPHEWEDYPTNPICDPPTAISLHSLAKELLALGFSRSIVSRVFTPQGRITLPQSSAYI